MHQQGKITTWKDDQGYGFITPNLGGKEVFVHIKAFGKLGQRPQLNQMVSFELVQDDRGRLQARQVKPVGSRPPGQVQRPAASPSNAMGPVFVIAFLLSLGLATLLGKLPHRVASLYLLVSLITYVAYAWDKAAARHGRRRTRESTLHLLALIGGWPGALLAQGSLRHKSSKAAFQFVFRATVLINCLFFIFLLTPQGRFALDNTRHLS